MPASPAPESRHPQRDSQNGSRRARAALKRLPAAVLERAHAQSLHRVAEAVLPGVCGLRQASRGPKRLGRGSCTHASNVRCGGAAPRGAEGREGRSRTARTCVPAWLGPGGAAASALSGLAPKDRRPLLARVVEATVTLSDYRLNRTVLLGVLAQTFTVLGFFCLFLSRHSSSNSRQSSCLRFPRAEMTSMCHRGRLTF